MSLRNNFIVNNLITAFFVAWFICGAVLVGVLVDGFILKTLWGWFVVPTFSIPPLTLPMAAGLACMLLLLDPVRSFGSTHDDDDDDDDDNDDDDDKRRSRKIARSSAKLRNDLTHTILRPVVILAVGWLITVLM